MAGTTMKGVLCAVALCYGPAAQVQAKCSLQLSSPQVVFEPGPRSTLRPGSAGGDLSFGVRRVWLNAQCRQSQPMSLRFEAPAANAQAYRFGVGRLQVRVRAARVDGRLIEGWRGADAAARDNVLRPGDRVRPWHNGQALAGRHLQLELEVEPLVPRQAANVRDITRFATVGRFELE